MEIADAVSCDFYDARNWKGCEQSRFRLSKQGEQVGLEIETERIGDDRETEELTSLNLARMDCETLRRIQSCLGEWLQQTSPEQTELRTRPVEGMYRDTSTEVEVYHLQIEVDIQRAPGTGAGLRQSARTERGAYPGHERDPQRFGRPAQSPQAALQSHRDLPDRY